MKNKTKSTKLIIVRHCQTNLNADGNRYQGIKWDLPLTEVGTKQANEIKNELAEVLEANPIDKIMVSPTLRAKQTAQIVAGENIEVNEDQRLCPFDLGDADGKRKDEMFTVIGFPIFARNKENFAKYIKRIRCCLADIIKDNAGKTVLVVTHKDISGVMDTYLRNLFILRAPSQGLENGCARVYNIDTSKINELKLTNKHNFGKLKTKMVEFDNQFSEIEKQ